MKLITETYLEGIESLVENTSTGRTYKIEGPFATYNKINANKRMYTESVMTPAMTKYITEKVATGRGFGELNHPQSPQVNFERVVMVIESLKDNKNGHWIGKGKIINEGMGKIVTAIMEAGGKVGVSTRALGTVRMQEGITYVNNDLMFSAIDVVSDPSGPGCFPEMVSEAYTDSEWDILEDGRIIQLSVDRAIKRLDEAKILKSFSEIMLDLARKNK